MHKLLLLLSDVFSVLLLSLGVVLHFLLHFQLLLPPNLPYFKYLLDLTNYTVEILETFSVFAILIIF